MRVVCMELLEYWFEHVGESGADPHSGALRTWAVLAYERYLVIVT